MHNSTRWALCILTLCISVTISSFVPFTPPLEEPTSLLMRLSTPWWATLLTGYVVLGLLFMRWTDTLSGKISALILLPPVLPFWWFAWSVYSHTTDSRTVALLITTLLMGYWGMAISYYQYQLMKPTTQPRQTSIETTSKPVEVEVIGAAITVVAVLAVIGAVAKAMERKKEIPPSTPNLPVLTEEQKAREAANRALHDRLVLGLPTDHDWWFANGEEFYTFYSGGWTFNHFRRHNAEPFGYSFMVYTNDRVTIDHYNERSEFIGWTDDTGARHTMSSNFPSGDKRWPLFRRYIQPFLNYQKLKE